MVTIAASIILNIVFFFILNVFIVNNLEGFEGFERFEGFEGFEEFESSKSLKGLKGSILKTTGLTP